MTDPSSAATPSSAVDDDHLLSELRRVGALADPVPDGWRGTARAAFSWAALDGEPAWIVHDARPASDGRGHGRLAAASQRTLRFRVGGGPSRPMVELELDVGADKVRATGRLRPPGAAVVVAMSADGHRSTPAGADGVFVFDEMPRRPFCLVVTGDAPLKTEWVVP